jgi:hypothetical protein
VVSVRQLLTDALMGRTPEKTPFSIYNWMLDLHSPDWSRLLDLGLGICRHCGVARTTEHGVTVRRERQTIEGKQCDILYKETPVGTVRQMHTNGWQTEYFIKGPADYKIMQWIVEHTELEADYSEFHAAREETGEQGIEIALVSRTPAMGVNLDWAGTEKFCLDLIMEVPELFDLIAARKKPFMEEIRIAARAPCAYVKSFENLTVSMLGPSWYEKLLLPAYREIMPVFEAAGKRYFVHYDGALSAIADLIAGAPFSGIESLTEPPEGDMYYDACRKAWPGKVFWANINVSDYYLPREQLMRSVAAKRERAGKQGLAFEISEDLPSNWKESIPTVLEALETIQ